MEFEKSKNELAEMRLRLASDGRLWLSRESDAYGAGASAEVAVQVRRCFPWSQPLAWLSLRSDEGKEIKLVESLELLNEASRRELLRALEEASFVFMVQEILSVDEEFELRHWRVRTLQGERLLQTRMNVWPRELADGSLLIQDVANDLYLIPAPATLDPASRKRLWAFRDDD
jgi:hypothetical protein